MGLIEFLKAIDSIFVLTPDQIAHRVWVRMTLTAFLWQLPLGLIMNNFFEWGFHRYIQHGLGKARIGPFADHFWVHHKNVRTNNYHDPNYLTAWWKGPQGREAKQLLLSALVPILYIHRAPWLTFGNWFGTFMYFQLHRYSHLHPEWGKKYLRWHWEHHMGDAVDANYCVTFPLADYVLGTRVYFDETKSGLRVRSRFYDADKDTSAANKSSAAATAGKTGEAVTAGEQLSEDVSRRMLSMAKSE